MRRMASLTLSALVTTAGLVGVAAPAAHADAPALGNGVLSFAWNATNPEQVDSITWTGSATHNDYVTSGSSDMSACPDATETFGQAYDAADGASIDEVTGGFRGRAVVSPTQVVIAGHDGDVPNCPAAHSVPVTTTYDVSADPAYVNEMQVTRAFHFGSDLGTAASLRPYVPRLPGGVQSGSYDQVVYPSPTGVVTTDPNDKTPLADWSADERWYAINDSSDGHGLLVVADPGNAALADPGLEADNDGDSGSNNSSIYYTPASGNWSGTQSFTFDLCFYDVDTWPQDVRGQRLPTGCGGTIPDKPGCTSLFTGNDKGGELWGYAPDWADEQIPNGPSDVACLAGHMVSIDGDFEAKAVENGELVVINSGDLLLDGPATSHVTRLTVVGTGNLHGTGTLAVDGDIGWSGGQIGDQDDDIVITQPAGHSFTIAQANPHLLYGGRIYTDSPVAADLSTLQLCQQGALSTTSSLTVSGTIPAPDGCAALTQFTAASLVLPDAAGASFGSYALNLTGGDLELGDGQTLAGSLLGIGAGATVGGSGTLDFGKTDNAGTIVPGGVATIGTLHINNTYQQEAGGTLDIDAASASNHDQVVAPTSAALSGTLELNLLGSYRPKSLVHLGILDTTNAAAPTGRFRSVVGNASHVAYGATYSAGGVTADLSPAATISAVTVSPAISRAGATRAAVHWTYGAIDTGARVCADPNRAPSNATHCARHVDVGRSRTGVTFRNLTRGTTYVFTVFGVAPAGPSYGVSAAKRLDGVSLSHGAGRTVTYKHNVRLHTTVKDTRTGKRLARKVVRLWSRGLRGSTWTLVGSATTSRQGVAGRTVTVTSSRVYQWRYSGDSGRLASASRTQTVRVGS